MPDSSRKVKKRFLFVCSANIYRSRTAEHHFRIKMAGSGLQFKSCGTDAEFIEAYRENISKESVPISRELCEWADVILVMEQHHADFIEENYGEEMRRKAFVLKIQDIFKYMDPELVAILDQKVRL